MTKWLLSIGLAATLSSPAAWADDPPRKNPFLGGEAAKTDEKKTETTVTKKIAQIRFSGDIDESPVAEESLFGAPGENLNSKIDRIRKAAKDPAVAHLFLELGDVSVGFGKLHELKTALADFRKTGKKVTAYAEQLSAKSYLLALACDEVVIPESGELLLTGLRAEVTLYKGLLDKVKLKADVLKVGAFKSAVEPFIAEKMSDANRQQVTEMLDDNYSHEIVNWLIAARPDRKWTPEQVRAVIDQGPFTAAKAKSLGLIDRIAYLDEVEGGLTKEKAEIVRGYGKPKVKEPDLASMMAMFSGGGTKTKRESKNDKIAVVYAVGGIESGKGGPGNPLMGGQSVGSDTLVEAIQEADKNPTVKAIVLRVDSPGGSALASDLIWRAITQCRKPVVASMGDVAASGGYYISMPCRKIYAEPGTITGSIGVFGMKLVTGELQEWAGVKTEVITRGSNTGVNSMTFAWTESERKAMTEYIDGVYDQFTTKAVAGRNAAGVKITKEELLKIAGGRVWTGRQAKANGLVDELGTLSDAIAGAKNFAGIDPAKEMELLVLPKPRSFIDKLMEGDVDLPFLSRMQQPDLLAIPEFRKTAQHLMPLLRTTKDPVKAFMPLMVEFK